MWIFASRQGEEEERFGKGRVEGEVYETASPQLRDGRQPPRAFQLPSRILYTSLSSQRITVAMLRRDPSHIQLNDSDVQDIRDYLAFKKSAANAQAGQDPLTVAQGSASMAPPPVPGQAQQLAQMPVNAAEEAKRRREAMSKDQRLGL
ncbi:hypothetical protein PUNSTDRAFT_132028 [Punctularia strigosozonata HHB-11173 SS5]|uniref:uncharacterized protein n=1 Tax=Punctularia strigosozonata (strain HHB-11173) TaxID=741275 RepID=UPI0004418435|nr:uncharacterized protein PUNSTDRAFT_132028 [Punctularia strigosozonata HHB-11173 SS5]EIN11881.1 hypothetical protein PUNSTDRAFT_132028 [Punctularia strigosozonata HHB-11173 SS5]